MISCCYPTGIFYDVRLKLPSCLENLPTPGLESHRCLTGRPVLIWLPNGEVQAVDDDVLHCLWAQQVQEVQLDAANADFWLLRQAEQELVTKCQCGLFNNALKSYNIINPVLFYYMFITLEAVIGFRQVCPPPVKLQETSIVSDAQPRFGSIQ